MIELWKYGRIYSWDERTGYKYKPPSGWRKLLLITKRRIHLSKRTGGICFLCGTVKELKIPHNPKDHIEVRNGVVGHFYHNDALIQIVICNKCIKKNIYRILDI